MLKTQKLTKEFMEACDLRMSETPTIVLDYKKLRALVKEEYEEFDHAMVKLSGYLTMNNDAKATWCDVIDALCDLVVVVHNTSNAMGVDLEPFFDEVHRANMTKVGGPKREDGKQLKPKGWTPPDHLAILDMIQCIHIDGQYAMVVASRQPELRRCHAETLNGQRCVKPMGHNENHVYESCEWFKAPNTSIFEELAANTGKLVTEKNRAYGDSVRNSAKIMQLLYPNGIAFDQIPGALVTVRIIDKLSRIANDPKYGGEDPAQDITGYGLLLQELIKNGL